VIYSNGTFYKTLDSKNVTPNHDLLAIFLNIVHRKKEIIAHDNLGEKGIIIS